MQLVDNGSRRPAWCKQADPKGVIGVPPAPARFSTTIGWPSWLESWSKTSRGTTSTALPAPNGTIALIGLVGQACARATYGKADSAAAPAAICRNRRRGSFIFIMDLPPSIGARGARTCRGHEGVMPISRTYGRIQLPRPMRRGFVCRMSGCGTSRTLKMSDLSPQSGLRSSVLRCRQQRLL
jgi:hypothetical protein